MDIMTGQFLVSILFFSFHHHCFCLLWPPCVADADIIFCPVVSSSIYLSFFFPRLISTVTDWMSAILARMVWPQCEFKMQV